MFYRLCVSTEIAILQLEDPEIWAGSQVHAQMPRFSGAIGPTIDFMINALLGNTVPNISVVVEPLTGTVNKDGSPAGCYGSVYRNESDFTLFPVEYPIKDFDRIDPGQIVYEGPLTILSMYKVDDNHSIVYQDFLESSLHSFDMGVWSAVFVTFLVFVGLLILRKCFNGIKDSTGYSATFETFSRMIGQDITDFNDRPGKLISIVMTVGFFLIIAFYFNCMSTDLVVVDKPQVINNYRDIMRRKDMTVGFFAITYDINEFKDAEAGSIQHEFWQHIKDTHIMVKFGHTIGEMTEMAGMVLEGKVSGIINSLYSHTAVKKICKFKSIVQKDSPTIARTYAWQASDPEGRQHTTGMIMRQGMKTDLVFKGKQKARRLFEQGMTHKIISETVEGVDLGPMLEGSGSVAEIMKCTSKEVNYNQPEVEEVNIENLKYLNLVCVLLFILSFTILIVENVQINRQLGQVGPNVE